MSTRKKKYQIRAQTTKGNSRDEAAPVRRTASPLGLAGAALILFTVVASYTTLALDSSLMAFTQERFYATDLLYFISTTERPGGLFEYAGIYFTRFLESRWIGGMLLASIVAAGAVFFSFSLVRLRLPRASAGALIPVAILLSAYNHPDFPASNAIAAVSALAAVGLLCAALPFSSRRHLIFLLLALALYAAGNWAMAPAGLLYLVHVMGEEPRRPESGVAIAARLSWSASLLLILAAVPWLVGHMVFGELPSVAYDLRPRLWMGQVDYTMVAFTLLIPLAAAILMLANRTLGSSRARWKAGLARLSALLILLPCAGATAVTFDPDEYVLVRLDQLAYTRQWPEYVQLVQAHRDHPVFSGADHARLTIVLHDLNRALYHTNRLGSELFSYPQFHVDHGSGVSPLLLADWEFSLQHREVNRKRADLMFEMGRVNEAEQLYFDAWAYHGQQPSILKRLAMLNLVKDRCKAACKFANYLERDPDCREWAQNLQSRSSEDPTLAWNPDLKRIRMMNFTQDVAGPTAYADQEYVLKLLLRDNPRNRMAYEYLMAYYLLNCDEASLANLVPVLKNFGDSAIPRHYEEAILFLLDKTHAREIDLGGLSIRPETVNRYERFRVLAREYMHDPEAQRRALLEAFGNTYWFYAAFGVTGFTNEQESIPLDARSGATP